MFLKNIKFRNFKTKNNLKIIKKKLSILLRENNEVINSLKQNYSYNFTRNL